ncbi:MAG: hypothetical protein N2560_04400 [Ignavibacteria bacterium]|nr:hypothetical protein [Ignavibacteria bacterium]
MKLRFALVSLFCVFIFASYAAATPFYFSIGGMNLVPTSKFKETNKPSLAFGFQLQDRSFCNLWYGVRFDFAKLDSLENVPIGTNYFSSYFLFSPELRYVFILSGKNSYDDTFYLFLQGLLNFSSISRKYEVDESNLGLGASGGLGLGFCFNLFKLCWAIEFDALYSSPNFILKSSKRPTLTNFNFGLTLGVRL